VSSANHREDPTDRPTAGPRIGSLCTGFGGLDLAVELVLGGHLAWYAETDPHASTVLANRWPAVPNLGDIRAVEWPTVAPVDILTAGFPCQDISNAGKRVGITGVHSSLWTAVADAVRALAPPYVFVENVAALLPRGLDVVHADLAALGYDTSWLCLRASDIGAAHRRDRLFLLYLDTFLILWPTSHLVVATTSATSLIRVSDEYAHVVDAVLVLVRIYYWSLGSCGPLRPQSAGCHEVRGVVGTELPVKVEQRRERPGLVEPELGLGQVAVEVLGQQGGVLLSAEACQGEAVSLAGVDEFAGQQQRADAVAQGCASGEAGEHGGGQACPPFAF
jgi:DNA (cytosine-5)-methyltransferase 1